jgi:hypothetical protein
MALSIYHKSLGSSFAAREGSQGDGQIILLVTLFLVPRASLIRLPYAPPKSPSRVQLPSVPFQAEFALDHLN